MSPIKLTCEERLSSLNSLEHYGFLLQGANFDICSQSKGLDKLSLKRDSKLRPVFF